MIGLSVVKDLPDYFSEIVVMNTGIPTGNNRSRLLFQPMKTLQEFVPFLLWRSCVKLLENNLPVEMMMSRIMKYPDSISKVSMLTIVEIHGAECQQDKDYFPKKLIVMTAYCASFILHISYGTVVRDFESEAKTRCNFQFR